MKRIILLFVVSLSVIVLLGCANTPVTMINYEIEGLVVNNYTDAAMVIVDGSVTNTGLAIELYYYGEDEGMTGTWYSLYIYDNNEWNELPYIVDGNVAWATIAYMVEKNHAAEMKVDWEWLYGQLSPGRYLILKGFMNFREAGDYDNYVLACEFTLQ